MVKKPTLTPETLDELIDKHLAEAKVPEAGQTTDVEFIRRVTLDLTGKLPSPEQVYNFVQTKARDKRPKLIEYLLGNKEFAANLADYWRDVIKFRATNINGGQVGYEDFEDWIAAQITKNRPWDEIAHDIITASGRNDENGGVALSLGREPGGRDVGRGRGSSWVCRSSAPSATTTRPTPGSGGSSTSSPRSSPAADRNGSRKARTSSRSASTRGCRGTRCPRRRIRRS